MDKKESVYLKLKTLYHGVDIERAAMEKIQELNTNFVQGLFSYHKNDVPYKIPHEFSLPNDVVVQIRYDENSPCKLRVEGENFYLHDANTSQDAPVVFPAEPEFYKHLTSDGTEMYKVVQLAGTDCLKIYTSNYCEFEKLDAVCKFCTVDSSRKLQDVVFEKNIPQITEAMKEAYDEGYYGHVMIAAGTYPCEDRGLVFISKMLNSVKKALGIDKIAGSVSTVPPKDLKYIQTIHDAGIEYLTFNLEIFDPGLFDKYCPGKSRYIGREHYFKAFKEAVRIFGKGKVRTNFVAGMEPLETLKQGFEEMAKIGVVPTVTMLSLNERNKYKLGEDFKMPEMDYFVEMFKALDDVYKKYNISPPWCAKCRTTSLEHEGQFLK